MAVKNAHVKPDAIGTFGRFDAKTVALSQQVLDQGQELLARVADTRANQRQLFMLRLFKSLSDAAAVPRLEKADSVPDVVKVLFELWGTLLDESGYTPSAVDALLRRLHEMRYLIKRDRLGLETGSGVPYMRLGALGLAYCVNHGHAVTSELNNFLITGSARGKTDVKHKLPANAYVTPFDVEEGKAIAANMSAEMVKHRFAAEQQGYHLQYDPDACHKVMEAVVNRDAEAAWPFIGDKFAFCTMFVRSHVTNDRLANSFLKYEVLPQATDPAVLEALASIVDPENFHQGDARKLVEEEVLRVAWMTLRTAVDQQTGLADAKRRQRQQGSPYDPEFTYDGTRVAIEPLMPDGTRPDLVVTFNDGEAMTIELKGRKRGQQVPANLAAHVEWVKEALEMYEDPEAFYDNLSEERAEAEAADWYAEQMVDQAKGS